MKTFEQVLDLLLDSNALHARFVNTLSLLEYLGARKILKSQSTETVTTELLAHASEEIRHAQIFKRFALKLSGGALDSYREEHLLCGLEARQYFHTIDEAASLELGTRMEWKNYLFTTFLIEERAMSIYPVYQRILKDKGIANPIGAIIRDEDQHLSDIRIRLERMVSIVPTAKERLRAIEKSQFALFLAAIDSAA